RAGITGIWVFGLLSGEDEHRQLGEVVAGDDVDPGGDHLFECSEPVAVEAGRIADPQDWCAFVTEDHIPVFEGSRAVVGAGHRILRVAGCDSVPGGLGVHSHVPSRQADRRAATLILAYFERT